MPAPRVSFARTLAVAGKDYIMPWNSIGRQLSTGTFRTDNTAETLHSLLSEPQRQPRFLADRDCNRWLANGAATGPVGPLVDLWTYRPIWKDEPVFPAATGTREMRLLSEVSGNLRKHNFEVPGFTDEEMKLFDRPWQVVVYVDVNESGRTTQVILETGCEDPKINSMVLKAMYRAKLPKPGTACGGRVILSYGLP